MLLVACRRIGSLSEGCAWQGNSLLVSGGRRIGIGIGFPVSVPSSSESIDFAFGRVDEFVLDENDSIYGGRHRGGRVYYQFLPVPT